MKVQIDPSSVPTTPSWLGEVAIVAHVLTQFGMLDAIQQRVQFARARFGHYDTIDFLIILIGYAVSGERTLEAFYERLRPFAPTFMALFGRHELPCHCTLSRFLAAFDQPSVEALRQLFQEDLVARSMFGSPPGGLWDRWGTHWLLVDIDATKQTARQRALPQTSDLPAPHRRFDRVCAKGYFGRKRGQVGRTRTTVLQSHTHQWLGTFSGPGNGDYRAELQHALQAITAYATAFSLPLAHVIVRVDGLYGNTAPVNEMLASHCGVIGRSKEYTWLDLPAVQARLQSSPDAQVTHPESGTVRDLYDCLAVSLTPQGPVLRLLVTTHPAGEHKPAVGVVRKETVYEVFYTTLPSCAFLASDVLHLYLHRGSFETVLSDEDQEQDPDRWVSRTPCGQECWQIISQWLWNLRLELGHHLTPTAMRVMEFSPAVVTEPAIVAEPVVVVAEPAVVAEPVVIAEPISYGPARWAHRSWTSGFAGSDFVLQPDGTLRCPAGHPLKLHERRPERNGSVRLVYGARACHCRPCSLRVQCQESTTTLKPRQVSAVVWPLPSNTPASTVHPPPPIEAPPIVPLPAPPPPEPAPFPVLWGDWPRCSIRRSFFHLLRSQTILLSPETVPLERKPANKPPDRHTRSQRAHWRLNWQERLACNARSSSALPLTITLHGLPATFAQFFGFALVTAA